MTKIIVGAVFIIVTGTAFAGITAAPEIDPSSAMSGLTLLLGGLTVWRARRSRR
jgi:hypothetical protein